MCMSRFPLAVADAALFLDFDGTLAPLAPHPDEVEVARTTRATLARLQEATGGALAIVSGREIAAVDAMLAPLRLPTAGAHGSERRDAQGHVHYDGDHDALAMAAARLEAFAEERALLFERKRGAAAIHFRARPETEADGRAFADSLVAEADDLRVIHGNMVAEIAIIGRDKGVAVKAFMVEPPFAGRVPVAVGDDVTDEDAIRAAQALGGTGIRIGTTETVAAVTMPDIEAFLDWLGRTAACGTLDR